MTTSNNCWFVLTLYTPTPTEFTEDSVYTNEISKHTIMSDLELFDHTQIENETIDNDVYVVGADNHTYVNTTEVIRIEL